MKTPVFVFLKFSDIKEEIEKNCIESEKKNYEKKLEKYKTMFRQIKNKYIDIERRFEEEKNKENDDENQTLISKKDDFSEKTEKREKIHNKHDDSHYFNIHSIFYIHKKNFNIIWNNCINYNNIIY